MIPVNLPRNVFLTSGALSRPIRPANHEIDKKMQAAAWPREMSIIDNMIPAA